MSLQSLKDALKKARVHGVPYNEMLFRITIDKSSPKSVLSFRTALPLPDEVRREARARFEDAVVRTIVGDENSPLSVALDQIGTGDESHAAIDQMSSVIAVAQDIRFAPKESRTRYEKNLYMREFMAKTRARQRRAVAIENLRRPEDKKLTGQARIDFARALAKRWKEQRDCLLLDARQRNGARLPLEQMKRLLEAFWDAVDRELDLQAVGVESEGEPLAMALVQPERVDALRLHQGILLHPVALPSTEAVSMPRLVMSREASLGLPKAVKTTATTAGSTTKDDDQIDFSVVRQANIKTQHFANLVGCSRLTAHYWLSGTVQPKGLYQTAARTALNRIQAAIEAGDLPLRSGSHRPDFTSLLSVLAKNRSEST
ncbi:MAG: hypothetical protein ACOVN2_10405 [Usitatibacteraceae bacterium]